MVKKDMPFGPIMVPESSIGENTIEFGGIKFRMPPKPPASQPAAAPQPTSAENEDETTGPAYPGLPDYMQPYGAGEEYGRKKYGEVGLDYGAFAPAMEQILQGYQSRLQGFNAPELAAQRRSATDRIMSQYLTGARNLRAQQGGSGISGAAAAAGQMQLMDQAGRAQAGFERDLLAKQADMQRQALGDYSNFMGGERATAMGVPLGYASIFGNEDARQQTMDLLNRYLGGGGYGGGGGGGGVNPLTPQGYMQGLVTSPVSDPISNSNRMLIDELNRRTGMNLPDPEPVSGFVEDAYKKTGLPSLG